MKSRLIVRALIAACLALPFAVNANSDAVLGADGVGSAFTNFVYGPGAQSASNNWQYFEIPDNLSTATLLSDWQTSGNECVSGQSQWDNNRVNGAYPFVQMVQTPPAGSAFGGTAALLIHPDDSNHRAAIGWKNTTGATTTIDYTTTLKLAFPGNNYNGITYALHRGLSGTARYSLLRSGIISTGSTATLSLDGLVELESGELLYLSVGNNGNYWWDHTIVTMSVNFSAPPVSAALGPDTIVTFSTVGTRTWNVPAGVTSAKVLVIGGGGGGGSDNGGGGGAGGFIEDSSVSVTPGVAMTVAVGFGGLGAVNNTSTAANGGNSSFGTLVARGGGGGGSIDLTPGADGGSAGGRAANRYGNAESAIATTSPSQGNNGGAKNAGGFGGGGGGGASSAGANGGSNIGGNGGAGRSSTITGSSIVYAGGGGGGGDSNTAGTGGSGGGGNGSRRGDETPTRGTDGLGGGGGAAGGSVAGGLGARGGSGIVIVRYTTPVATTTTSTTTTTTVARSATTTVAPALDIVVNAPVTTVAVGQSAIPKVNSSSTSSTAPTAQVTSNGVVTTTTTPSVGSGTVAPPAPKIGAVAPGEAAVMVGDKAETATVKRSENQVTVTAGALSATLGSLDSKGGVAALDAEGNVRLKPGDTVRIKLAGFQPGSDVEAWLFSTPQLLGTVKVGTDGVVVGTFMIPKNVDQGSHRIAVVAKTVDGKPATLTLGIKVGEWKKERSIALWIIILPIVLAVFGALVLPATRRRKRKIA